MIFTIITASKAACPEARGEAVSALSVVVSVWQGILLWKGEPGETQAAEINASQPDQA
jgi:hypothetical protein